MKERKKMIIILFYRPPSADIGFHNNLRIILERRSLKGIPKILLLGDLNTPGVNWDELPSNNGLCDDLCNICMEYG